MSACARLASMTAACATVLGLVVPLSVAAPANADPCSVPTPSAQSRTASPSIPAQFPNLHLPTGRKPKSLDQATDPNTPTTEGAQQDAANAKVAVAPAPAAETATRVGWITGPNTNSLRKYGISGADLGIMWDNGETGNKKQVLVAFGDTFGDCSVEGQQWRSNTLFRSAGTDLAVLPLGYQNPYAGSPISAPANAMGQGFSRQIIDSLRLAATEVTVIPTAAISVGTTQYVNFMSVAQWGASGQWSTNFSAVAVSTNNGESWTVPRTSIRPAWFNSVPGVPFVWGYQNFQMGAYLRCEGYIYNYGTTAGRGGAPFLSRVVETGVADLTQYEYWTPFGWSKNTPFLAVQVTVAPGSEMSVAFNDYLGKFVMMYTNFLGNVVLRTADTPQGPWSLPKTLVTTAGMPGGIYAPYIHPWSSGPNLYFTLSLWSNYSVMLMKTTLSR
jgi:Domain of unknown function (DUF4185)